MVLIPYVPSSEGRSHDDITGPKYLWMDDANESELYLVGFGEE